MFKFIQLLKKIKFKYNYLTLIFVFFITLFNTSPVIFENIFNWHDFYTFDEYNDRPLFNMREGRLINYMIYYIVNNISHNVSISAALFVMKLIKFLSIYLFYFFLLKCLEKIYKNNFEKFLTFILIISSTSILFYTVTLHTYAVFCLAFLVPYSLLKILENNNIKIIEYVILITLLIFSMLTIQWTILLIPAFCLLIFIKENSFAIKFEKIKKILVIYLLSCLFYLIIYLLKEIYDPSNVSAAKQLSIRSFHNMFNLKIILTITS